MLKKNGFFFSIKKNPLGVFPHPIAGGIQIHIEFS